MHTAKHTFLFFSTFLLAGLIQAQGQGISYNYAEARFLDSEVGVVDGDGIEIAGSYQVDAEWLVHGSYSNQDFDFVGDLEIIEVGVGYLLPSVNGFNLAALGSVISSELGDDDDNGIKISALARTDLTRGLEGRASLNYVNVSDSDLFIEIGVDYFFTSQFAAGAEVQLGSDTDTVSLGVRWFYDQ